jgi:hypothetical protein
MGTALASPGLIEAKETGVDVMERAGFLGQRVAFETKVLLFVETGFDHEFHVGVNGESVGSTGIPVEFVTESGGILERERTIDAKVCPGMLIGLARNALHSL